MKVLFLYLKSSQEPWAEVAAREFEKKIQRIIPFEVRALRSKSVPRDKAQYKIVEEEKLLLKEVCDEDLVYIFDEKGKSFDDSVALSRVFIQAFESGKQRVVFIVGGAFGLGPAIKERSDRSMSLSGLTMNHLVAKVVALEQIYRSLTIWRGIPYHN